MASTIPSISEEEILLCCICLETLEEPKILGCLHRFCKKCLVKVIDKIPDGGRSFQCPTCRHDQSLPENGADGVSDDFLLRGILENRKLERDIRNEKKDQTCGSCKRFTTVVAICPHCGGFICETCHIGHTLMKIFEDHTHMVTLEEIETGKVTFDVHQMKAVSNTPKCPSHKDMTLHINCKTCDQLICPACVPLHHQSHEFEEIHAAAERVKGTIGTMVKESDEKEESLEREVEEIKEIRSRYEREMIVIGELVETEAQKYEEDVQMKKQEDLEELDKKRRWIEQKAEESLLAISREQKFVEDEIRMATAFVQQSLDNVERVKLDKIRKVKDCQMTSGILTKDVDDWSLLKVAPDIQKVLSVDQDKTNIQHLKDASLRLPQFPGSPLTSQCWRNGQYNDVLRDMGGFSDLGYSNMTIFNIRGQEASGELSVTAVGQREEKSRYSASQRGKKFHVKQSVIAVMKFEEEDMEVLIHIPGTNDNLFHVGNIDGVLYSLCNDSEGSSLYQDGKYLIEVGIPSKARCCTLYPMPPDEGMLISVEGSTTLYIFNLYGDLISELPVEVDGLKPPVSLSVIGGGRIQVLLCDGESKALAVTAEGGVVARFESRCPTDKPLRIAADDGDFVYVLWDIEDGTQRLRDIEAGADPSDGEDDEGEYRDDGKLPIKKVVQYSNQGVYISEVYVKGTMTLMTTMTGNDGKVLVVASPDGDYQFFEMTPFGVKFSQFIQNRDNSKPTQEEEEA